ncbi:MAG TPA: hypothetical protein HPQ04_06385 [Rhodospirillaceae bacterium]|nr:hypothetical protein [Rhodospirillaceae bacterium]
MWAILASIGLIVAITSPTSAADRCDGFMRAYEGASKMASLNYAQAVGDNSVPRATLAEI